MYLCSFGAHLIKGQTSRTMVRLGVLGLFFLGAAMTKD